jgi:hypothetical protein
MSRGWIQWTRGGVASSCLLFASAASAEVTKEDAIAATARFNEGKKLLDKKPAEACAKFEESYRLDPTLGTRLNLAVCYERIGKTASAWTAYVEVADGSRASGRADREQAGRKGAAALEPHLSMVVINAPSAGKAPGIEIKLDRVVVGKDKWGVAMPVDPGVHVVSAAAPERKGWRDATTIEGGGKRETIEVPELEVLEVSARPNTPGGAPAQVAIGPGRWAGPPPQMVPYSPGMFATGLVFLFMATGGLAAGAAVMTSYANVGGTAGFQAGAIAMGVSANIFILGAFLTGFGIRYVPLKPSDVSARDTLRPSLLVGPGYAGMRVSF